MVTNLVEGNPSKLKCHRYWPDPALDNGASSRVYGGFEVKYIKQEQSPNYVVRTFQLKNKSGSQTREIKHFHYISWPDHGVPETAKEFLQFRTVVKQHHTANAKGQMVVHCIAGVGRTGVFIGIDRYLDSCISLDDQLSVLDVVRNMRTARNYMVQAQAQFIYLYEACRKGLQTLQEKIDSELEMYDRAHQVEVAETPEAATAAHEDVTAKVLAEINADLKRTTEQFKDNMSCKDQLGQQIKPAAVDAADNNRTTPQSLQAATEQNDAPSATETGEEFAVLRELLAGGLHASVISASLQRAKLLLVGRGRSGKSSTLQALKKGRAFDERERSTAAARQDTLAVFAQEDVQAQEWTEYKPIGQERQRVCFLCTVRLVCQTWPPARWPASVSALAPLAGLSCLLLTCRTFLLAHCHHNFCTPLGMFGTLDRLGATFAGAWSSNCTPHTQHIRYRC